VHDVFKSDNFNAFVITRDRPKYRPIFVFLPIYRYRPKRPNLSASVGVDKTLLYSSRIRKTSQESATKQVRQLSCNASRCGFINKQTKLTMKRASAVAAETKASSGSFAMLEAATCRCCVRINSRCTSGSFRSTESLTAT